MKKINNILIAKEKAVSIFILFLFITGHLFARPVDQNHAMQVARNFISGSSSFRSSVELTLIHTATNDISTGLRTESTPLYYIFNRTGQEGFVIVSADDKTMPILGYADKGNFRMENIPDNLKYWLDFYKEEIIWAIENIQENGSETTRAWSSLLTGNTRNDIIKDFLLPTANWDQGEPFNDLCPLIGSKRTVTGCVATAMGIIMKHHEWPQKGTGKITYTTKTKSLKITEDLNATYDWDNMPDVYISDPSTPSYWTTAQRNSVGTLLYHCGVASYMDFDTTESGTTTQLAKHALINNFGYDNGMYYTRRNFYTNSEWDAMIRTELQENRPVLYGGQTRKSEGHQFIIDGYNSQDYYHINWGWGGLANGYYLLSSLEPSMQGIGGSEDGAGFSREQDMLIGLEKAKEGSLPGYEFYFILDGPFRTYGLHTNVKEIRKGEPFNLSFTHILDAGFRDFEGYLAFFVVDKKGNRKELLGSFQTQIPGGTRALFDLSDNKYDIKGTVQEGDKIQLFFSVDEKNWKVFRGDTQLAITEIPVYPAWHVSNESIAVNNISVYPTTVESEIHIESEDNIPIQRINIYNLTGRLIKDRIADGAHTILNVNDLTSGIYILSVQTAKGGRSFKIIKK